MDTTEWLPPVIAIGVTLVVILAARLVVRRRGRDSPESAFRTQAWTIGLLLAGIVATLFTLPEGSNQELLLGVVGLIVTATIALSSQSIIANGMAGLMLRVVSDYRPGDFIEVGEHMGRVSEMTLLHTEIQTADRNLTTLPNALLMVTPVTVVRSSGTIVSATVSLGYDVSYHWVEPLFIAAAAEAELEEGFVQVTELGDYSVTYRVAGFLADPARLLRARSELRMAILDTLHAAEVEIMSPMFLTRREADGEAEIPDSGGISRRRGARRRTAEDRIFDKAEIAGGIEAMKQLAATIAAEIDALEAQANGNGPDGDDTDGGDGQAQVDIEHRIEAEQRRLQAVENRIERLIEQRDGD